MNDYIIEQKIDILNIPKLKRSNCIFTHGFQNIF